MANSSCIRFIVSNFTVQGCRHRFRKVDGGRDAIRARTKLFGGAKSWRRRLRTGWAEASAWRSSLRWRRSSCRRRSSVLRLPPRLDLRTPTRSGSVSHSGKLWHWLCDAGEMLSLSMLRYARMQDRSPRTAQLPKLSHDHSVRLFTQPPAPDLQVNMGYSGGGPTPLCGVKRMTRVGLQEDEVGLPWLRAERVKDDAKHS